MSRPLPIEQSDPEFAELILGVVEKRIPAFVQGTRVFERVAGVAKFGRVRIHTRFKREVMLDVGRNDPCVCGSGRKFKKCCGRAG